MELIYTLDNIRNIAAQVYKKGKSYSVWSVEGNMGAGKTTFIHALCEHLGVTSAVGSPTYSIINQYVDGSGRNIYHMDWYRLKDEEEALQAGVEDAMLKGGLCLVEWMERAPGLEPDNCLHVQLAVVDANTRKLVVQGL